MVGAKVNFFVDSAANVQSYLAEGNTKLARTILKDSEAWLKKLKNLLTGALSTISQLEYLKTSKDADENFVNMCTKIHSKLQNEVTRIEESAE